MLRSWWVNVDNPKQLDDVKRKVGQIELQAAPQLQGALPNFRLKYQYKSILTLGIHNLYLIAVAGIIYAILRRLGCSSCYRCKTCTSGFGRLAGAFFGKGYVKKESVSNRFGIIAFIYFLLCPVPAARSAPLAKQKCTFHRHTP